MPNIQATANTYPARAFSETAADRAPSQPNTSSIDTAQSNTHPQNKPREIQQVIYRFKRDEAAGVEAAERYGSKQVGAQSFSREIAMGGILHQMRTICAPAQALEWKPVPGVSETLCALAQYVQGATETEKQAIGAKLKEVLEKAVSSHRHKDMALLATMIDRTLQGEDPMDALARFAETSLNLPNTTIRVEGQEEPPQLHFDSTLLPFAGASYDYGPLGRTLMFEGALHCFAGVSQAQRGAKLREIFFALPHPPATAAPLEDLSDIFMALLDCGITI